MTKLSIMSDLHLEFGDINLPGGDILILAGDIWTAKHMREKANDAESRKLKTRFMRFCLEELVKYERVFLVMGNHEHYGLNVKDTAGIIHEFLAKYAPHATLLDNDFRKEYGFMFIGSTLWACYGVPNPVQENKIANYMTDCRVIKINDPETGFERNALPSDLNKLHKKCKERIYMFLNKNVGTPKILITHHAPSWMSAKYSGYEPSDTDYAYYCNLEKAFARKHRVKLAVHGHTHVSCMYTCHSSVVASNQRGYKGTEQCAKTFDPTDGDVDLEQLLKNEEVAPDERFIVEGDNGDGYESGEKR